MQPDGQRRIVNQAAWALGGLSIAALTTAAALLWRSDASVDAHLVAALITAGVILDWLPIRWVRKAESWVVHSAGVTWAAAGLALLPAPAFVVAAGLARCGQMLLKGRFGDGVSRANYDAPRVWVNLALVVLPATVGGLATAPVDMPVAAGLIGAGIYWVTSTIVVTTVVNIARGAAATDGLWGYVRTRSPDVLGEMVAAIPVILAIRAMGPWLPLLTLSGAVVLMWRQAVKLHIQTTLNTALLDLTAAATDASTKRDLYEAVDQAGRSIFGRPVCLRQTDHAGEEEPEEVAAVVPVPGEHELELVIGYGSYNWPFRVGPFERKALQGLGATASMGWTAVRAREQLKEQAVRDPLSGLLNRRGFSEYGSRVHERTVAGENQSTLAYLDLDGFKRVNDTLGHDAGDAVIEAVGAALREHLRPTDVAGRLGGDEFAVLFADELDEKTARGRISAALSQLPHGVGSSVGIARSSSQQFDELLTRADQAMYEDKMARRGQSASAPR